MLLRRTYSAAVVWDVLYMSMMSIWSSMQFNSNVLLLHMSTAPEGGAQKSPAAIVLKFVSLGFLIFALHIYLHMFYILRTWNCFT